MPVQRVLGPNGKVGYRWGQTGKIYTGPEAREKAARQGRAAYRSGYRPKPGEKLWRTNPQTTVKRSVQVPNHADL
jgi:hypothetical protein